MRRSLFLFSAFFACLKCEGAFLPSNGYTSLHSPITSSNSVSRLWEQNESRNPFSFFLNPYESKIPKEIEKEIYEAEGNTAAAKDRNQRVALYAAIAFVGVLCAFFNGFLTELRNAPEGITLEDAGFGWVESNFLLRFLFLNKIGGWICLLGGAGSGLLAEAEYDTRRINAEKIWEELQRRREAKEKKDQAGKQKKKKRRSGKETKRIGALSEVIETEKVTTNAAEEASTEIKEDALVDEELITKDPEKKAGGVLETIKEYYQKADTLAASQALLLNKKLEEQGLLEKITDETGLRVVGREEAARIQQENEKKQAKDEINKQ